MQLSVEPKPDASATLRPCRIPKRISMKLLGPGTTQVARLTARSEARESMCGLKPDALRRG